ncbi:hypothetical protein LZ31DRAFT_594833 [Colletotrichum somersetense]|nr:hypothetical protein LZ31DRAFT_594833 [Colletotrichum somersetense]
MAIFTGKNKVDITEFSLCEPENYTNLDNIKWKTYNATNEEFMAEVAEAIAPDYDRKNEAGKRTATAVFHNRHCRPWSLDPRKLYQEIKDRAGENAIELDYMGDYMRVIDPGSSLLAVCNGSPRQLWKSCFDLRHIVIHTDQNRDVFDQESGRIVNTVVTLKKRREMRGDGKIRRACCGQKRHLPNMLKIKINRLM